MLTVANVIFDYPGHRALNDVSFAIEPQSITALVGPNGAGKSTLLRVCAALDRPFAGEVTLDGLDIHDEARLAHSRMGYLPDFYGLYDELTVLQSLRYRAAALGVPVAERDDRIAVAAERMEILDRMHTKAGALSRGLRQRLAIAQAIIHEPKLLLLDEPAAGLDPEARIGLSAVLRSLRAQGMTIIVSSHILAELEDYSTHMLVIRDGRILDHRPITAEQVGDHVRVRVTLEMPDDRLGQVLAAEVDLRHISIEGPTASFEMPASRSKQAALLRRLVEAGLAVAEFAVERESLEEVYLKQVKAAPGGKILTSIEQRKLAREITQGLSKREGQ